MVSNTPGTITVQENYSRDNPTPQEARDFKDFYQQAEKTSNKTNRQAHKISKESTTSSKSKLKAKQQPVKEQKVKAAASKTLPSQQADKPSQKDVSQQLLRRINDLLCERLQGDSISKEAEKKLLDSDDDLVKWLESVIGSADSSDAAKLKEQIEDLEKKLTAISQQRENDQKVIEELKAIVTKTDVNKKELSTKISSLEDQHRKKCAQTRLDIITLAQGLKKLAGSDGTEPTDFDALTAALNSCMQCTTRLAETWDLNSDGSFNFSGLFAPMQSFEMASHKPVNDLHEKVIVTKGKVDTVLKKLKADSKQNFSGTNNRLEEYRSTLKELAKELLDQTNTAVKLKKSMEQDFKEGQKLYHDGEVSKIPDEILKDLAKVSSIYTVDQMQKDKDIHDKLQKEIYRKLDDMLSNYHSITEKLTKSAHDIKIAMLNCDDPDFKSVMEKILSNLNGNLEDPDTKNGLHLCVDSVTIPEIKSSLISISLDEFSEELSNFPELQRGNRKDVKRLGVPTDDAVKKIFLAGLQTKYDDIKGHLTELDRRYKALMVDLNKKIEQLQLEVDIGEGKSRIPLKYIERMAAVRGIKPEEVSKEISEFKMDHANRVILLNTLKGNEKRIAESAAESKVEVNRAYAALLNGGKYTTEKWYSYVPTAIGGCATDPEVDALFN